MSKKRNKITVFIVAALMFTSTWAGVFAADPGQPGDGDQGQTPAVTNTDGQEDTGVNNDGGTPAEADTTQGGDVNTKDDGDEEEAVPAINAPTATVSGNTITVAWDAVEGASGYAIIEKVNGEETSDPVYDGEETTCTLENKVVGKYAYKVAVKGSTDESDYSTEVVVRPSAVTGIKALSGKNCIVLNWIDQNYSVEKNNGYGYIIYRYNTSSGFYNSKPEKRIDPNMYGSYLSNTGDKVTWTNSNGVKTTQNYWYRVYAAKQIVVGADWSEANIIKSSQAFIKDKGCVRPMYIKIKLKKKRTLKAIDGSGKRITLKKGYQLTSDGFGGGCYYFSFGNHRYRISRTSTRGQVALYNGRNGYNYTPEEAELFIKQSKLTSKTNYMIWVSFYTQRVYIMQKTSAGWKCIKNWDCATGKASTPSPTGHKMVGKKKSSHHNIKWWSSFSNMTSIANSLHGKKKGWKLGLPQSHGCIRNEVANAKWIYDHCPKYTKVYNY